MTLAKRVELRRPQRSGPVLTLWLPHLCGSPAAPAPASSRPRKTAGPVERRALADLPDVEAYAVDAQPGYIVLAAVRGWLDPAPDLVLSGVNHGANVGRAILHSGTVGAALTAGVNGVRELAVFLDVGQGSCRSAALGHGRAPGGGRSGIAGRYPSRHCPPLNVPNRPVEALSALRHATLAKFGTVQSRVDRLEDGRLGLADVETGTQPAPGTDSALLAAGQPTLTALASVREASSPVLWQWLASAVQRTA